MEATVENEVSSADGSFRRLKIEEKTSAREKGVFAQIN